MTTQNANAASGSSAIETPTKFIDSKLERYAYRRLGKTGSCPILCLQHFTGTLDNWDPALIDFLAAEHDVILFDNAGIGQSGGSVPTTIAEMTKHALAFVDAMKLSSVDILGFSLGGMIAQQMVLDRPSVTRRLILAGTAPRGGEDIMHLEKPRLAKFINDPTNKGYAVLQKIFFPLTDTAQAAGAAFIARLAQRKTDLDHPSGPAVAQAQMASFREWDKYDGERFADLKRIKQPTLVFNGLNDEMIATENSFWLAQNIPDAVLLAYPDAGHAGLFQYSGPFGRQVCAFLCSDSPTAPY